MAEKMSGVTAPFGFFDPMGLTPETNEELQLFREAELAHGRVAMVGALGFLVQEQFHPLFADVGGPAIRQLDVILQTPNGLSAGTVMLFGIFFSEWARAKIGWVEPEVEMRSLRESYSPGDLGFDPLGQKPKDEAGLKSLDACAFVVIDEVDSFLDDDERRDALHRLLNDHLPRQRSTVFATASVDAPQRLPGDLLRRRWATRPVSYLSSERGMPTIQHTLVLCPKPEARLAVLRQFLKGVKTATVVFFDEKRLSLLPKIAAALKQDDLRVDVLNEADDLESRSSAFEAFVRGEVDVLLTTDLAARGLDAPRTSLVINFDVPRTATDYLHRAGRTARLGRSGAVLTICEKSERFALERFGNKLGVGVDEVAAGSEAYARLAGVGE